MIDLKMSELKRKVLEDTDKLLAPNGFRCNKSKQTFTKRIGKDRIEFAFDFLNYFPDWYEYKFGFSIDIEEIKKLKEKLYAFAGMQRGLTYAVHICQGNFIEDLKDAEYKYRMGYYDKVCSADELENSIGRTL